MSGRDNIVGVALMGFGNVGRALVRYLLSLPANNQPKLRIELVADSSGVTSLGESQHLAGLLEHKLTHRSVITFGERFDSSSDFIDQLSRSGVRVLIESLPTNIESGQPALDLLEAALSRGIHVVTVNKGPLVHGFDRLHSAAAAGSARIAFSGTTGVSLPEDVVSANVYEIRGVLNGTTNYILSEMQQKNESFDEALAQAQADGIAEPDPRLDIEGWDTACKILILARAAMRADATLEQVSRIGIGPETESLIQVARSSGKVVRLVGRARIWQGRVRVSVAPKLVTPESALYSISGASKAAIFSTRVAGDLVVLARSGRDAISQTIVDDVQRILSH